MSILSRHIMRYEKTPGAANLLGQQYEYKMAALLLMRGVNQTAGFCMGTNVAGAGAFDDVIFKYKLKDDTEFRTCLIQLKHKENEGHTITLDQLVKPSGNFSMYKYYKSWCEVAMKVESKEGETHWFFNVKFSNCDFLIYTNGKIDKSLTSESKMKSCNKTIFTTNKDYPQCYPSYFNELTAVKLKEDCEKQMANDKALKENLKEVMKNHPVEKFLRSLQWFTEQASEKQLDSLIEEEIKTALEANAGDTKKIVKTFVEKIKLWWEEKEKEKGNDKEKETSTVLTESAQLWGDIIISLLNSNHVKWKEMEELNIRFTDQEIDFFNQSLSSSLVINVTSPHGKLSSMKISQVLEKHHSKRFIFMDEASLLSRKPEVLLALKNTWCDVLVIECSTNAESLVAEVNTASSGKKLILLSESALPGYQPLQDIFSWNQLEATSQQILLEKRVDFQGYDVSLGSVVGEHCTHALTGEVVTKLISPGAKLALGKKTPDNISYYIPRSLERIDYINKEMFRSQTDFFIISNVEEQDVHSLEDSYRVKLKKFDENQYDVSHHFFWADNLFNSDKFTRFCQQIPSKNVHWLSVDQSNCVYWKQSFNNMDVVKINIDSIKKRLIDAEDLKDVNERVVLVAAEPGMGKTTYLYNVAQVAKSQDNSLYVLRIDLNNITRHLQEHDEQYFRNHENITDFLIDLTTNCELDIEILRSRLTKTGNVNIYLDGYDEISPYYNDKVTNMIKSMIKLKFGPIWLTSRNVMRHHLESKLASICYFMKPFTDEDQISFLVKLWNAKHSIQIDDTSREFAGNLLKKASESFSDKDREFTGIPLQCMMLGEVFAGHVKKGILNLPKQLNLLHLFEIFVSDKLSILNENKDQIESSNPREISKRKKEQILMMRNHSEAAIILLLSDKEVELLKVNIMNISLNVEESFSVGEEAWKGLVDGMTDGKPSFIHRCFAEYFLAWGLSENILSSTDFIAQKLFEPRFVIVRQFFDRLLARDCPVHNAVLSADRDQVEALLTSGADVNQLDKEGRSALHLAASYPEHGSDNDNDSENSSNSDHALGFLQTAEASIMQLLLTHGANVSLTDRILQGTPLRYADRNKLWGKVELLLKNKANTDDLVELRELINNSTKEEDETNERIFKARRTCYAFGRECFHIVQFSVDEFKLPLNTRLINGLYETSYLLHAAVESGRNDSVKFLLDRGADMMQGDGWKMLPIHNAARAGHHDMMPLLIESGVNVASRRQLTPLHYAVMSGRPDIVKWLVGVGAELDAKDLENKTPLYWAVCLHRVDIAKILIEFGADQHCADSRGITPAHLAEDLGPEFIDWLSFRNNKHIL